MDLNKFNIGDRVSISKYNIKDGLVVGFTFYTNENSIYDSKAKTAEEYIGLLSSVDYDIVSFDEDGNFYRDTYSEEHID